MLIEGRWDDEESETGAGCIRFLGWGQQAQELIEPLIGEVQKVAQVEQPRITWQKKHAATAHTSQESDLRQTQTRDITSLNIGTPVQGPVGLRTVYISYAWGDDSSEKARQRGQVVDGLCATLESGGWKVIRDQSAMQYGDLITDFIKTLTHSDYIIVVISEKYLRSPWCMAELYGIYQRCSGGEREFVKHLIPLTMDDAKFSSWCRIVRKLPSIGRPVSGNGRKDP